MLCASRLCSVQLSLLYAQKKIKWSEIIIIEMCGAHMWMFCAVLFLGKSSLLLDSAQWTSLAGQSLCVCACCVCMRVCVCVCVRERERVSACACVCACIVCVCVSLCVYSVTIVCVLHECVDICTIQILCSCVCVHTCVHCVCVFVYFVTSVCVLHVCIDVYPIQILCSCVCVCIHVCVCVCVCTFLHDYHIETKVHALVKLIHKGIPAGGLLLHLWVAALPGAVAADADDRGLMATSSYPQRPQGYPWRPRRPLWHDPSLQEPLSEAGVSVYKDDGAPLHKVRVLCVCVHARVCTLCVCCVWGCACMCCARVDPLLEMGIPVHEDDASVYQVKLLWTVVCVCVCACVCACVYAYMHMCVCVFICSHVHGCVGMHVWHAYMCVLF